MPGVFVGGCSIEAVQAVYNASSDQTLTVVNGLAALVNHSLVRQEADADGEPWFIMLETIREYALDCLHDTGEETVTRHRHATYFWARAERADPELRGPQQMLWLNRLIPDSGNFRAALSWCLEQSQDAVHGDSSEPDHAVLGLRLAGALWWFWNTRTERGESRHWLTLAIDQPGMSDLPARVRALAAAGWTAHLQDDNAIAMAYQHESLALAHSLNDARGAARALLGQALITRKQGEFARASARLAESLMLCYVCGDRWLEAYIHFIQGLVAMDQADYITAQQQLGEGFRRFEQCGDRRSSAWPRHNQGQTARFMGDFQTAAIYYEQSVEIFRSMKDHAAVAEVSVCIGHLARMLGDDRRAWTIYREQLVVLRRFDNRRHSADCFDGIADMTCRNGRAEWAAQILGVAAALREAIGVPVSRAERDGYEQIIRRVHDALGTEVFAAAYAIGHTHDWEAVVEEIQALPAVDSNKNLHSVRATISPDASAKEETCHEYPNLHRP